MRKDFLIKYGIMRITAHRAFTINNIQRYYISNINAVIELNIIHSKSLSYMVTIFIHILYIVPRGTSYVNLITLRKQRKITNPIPEQSVPTVTCFTWSISRSELATFVSVYAYNISKFLSDNMLYINYARYKLYISVV